MVERWPFRYVWTESGQAGLEPAVQFRPHALELRPSGRLGGEVAHLMRIHPQIAPYWWLLLSGPERRNQIGLDQANWSSARWTRM